MILCMCSLIQRPALGRPIANYISSRAAETTFLCCASVVYRSSCNVMSASAQLNASPMLLSSRRRSLDLLRDLKTSCDFDPGDWLFNCSQHLIGPRYDRFDYRRYTISVLGSIPRLKHVTWACGKLSCDLDKGWAAWRRGIDNGGQVI